MTAVRWFLVSVVLFLTVTNAWAASAAKELDGELKQLKAMQANFTQRIETANKRILQESSGIMALQRPGKFRWELLQPNKQLIIANDGKLWVYDQDLAQVNIQSVNKMRGTPALLLSTDNQQLLARFKVSKLQAHKPNVAAFLLQPKHQDELFSSLQLHFASSTLQQIIMTDGLGQITYINFTQVQAKHTLPKHLFQLVIPQEVEVIDTRQGG